MVREWDYAELSKLAKRFDGPKNMVDALQKSSQLKGFKAGKAAERPKKMLYGVIGALAGAVGLNIYEHLSRTEEPDESEELYAKECAVVEQALISGIEQYDSKIASKESVYDQGDPVSTNESSVSDTMEGTAADELDEQSDEEVNV